MSFWLSCRYRETYLHEVLLLHAVAMGIFKLVRGGCVLVRGKSLCPCTAALHYAAKPARPTRPVLKSPRPPRPRIARSSAPAAVSHRLVSVRIGCLHKCGMRRGTGGRAGAPLPLPLLHPGHTPSRRSPTQRIPWRTTPRSSRGRAVAVLEKGHFLCRCGASGERIGNALACGGGAGRGRSQTPKSLGPRTIRTMNPPLKSSIRRRPCAAARQTGHHAEGRDRDILGTRMILARLLCSAWQLAELRVESLLVR